MAKDVKYGQMAVFMKDIGKMIKLTAEEDLFLLVGMFILGNGRTIKLMEKVNSHIQTGLNSMAVGFQINKKVTEKKLGLMEPNIKATTSKTNLKVTANLLGPTTHPIEEALLKIIYRAKEYIGGQMIKSMMEIGLTTKCMVVVNSRGLMVADMRENSLMTKKMDTVHSHGQTKENTMVSGKMTNKKGQAYFIIRRER